MIPSRHAPPGYACPFCRLVQGAVDEMLESRPTDVAFQDALTTVFVCSRQYPNNPGHVLVVPNAHFENLYELPDELGARLHAVTRRAALAMRAAYGCDGVSTRQHNEPAGNQDVWHYHTHVFPRYRGDDLYVNFLEGRTMLAEERAQYAARLRAAWPEDLE